MAKNLTGKPQVEIERTTKTSGVEIEFFGTTREAVKAAIEAKGLQVEIEGWAGTKRFRGAWKLTTDASVTSTGTGIGRGLELVSPPLTIAEMERQLKLVCEALNECNAKVDRSAGVHVHHHIDDLNLNQIKNIYRIYDKHQASIDEFFPKSRRGSQRYVGSMTEYDMEKVEAATSIHELVRGTERYRNVNFQSYVKYGTIEFRQHAGSTDFEKIFNWVLISQMIVTAATKKKSIRKLGESVNKTMAFNKEIGIYATRQGGFFRDRKKELRKLYKTA